jgi:hypothetical protein
MGSDRWYGIMPIECLVVWITVPHGDREETIANESQYKRRRKKKEEKKMEEVEERAEKKGKECKNTPTH